VAKSGTEASANPTSGAQIEGSAAEQCEVSAMIEIVNAAVQPTIRMLGTHQATRPRDQARADSTSNASTPASSTAPITGTEWQVIAGFVTRRRLRHR
jgi:hypothetical protein